MWGKEMGAALEQTSHVHVYLLLLKKDLKVGMEKGSRSPYWPFQLMSAEDFH